MRKLCFLFLFCAFGIQFSFAQTINIKVIPLDLYYAEQNGGVSNDCGYSIFFPSNSKPDPRWRVTTTINASSFAWNPASITNFNVGWIGGISTGAISLNNQNINTTITTRFKGWEEDNTGPINGGSNCGSSSQNRNVCANCSEANIQTISPVYSVAPGTCNVIENNIVGNLSPIQGGGGIYKIKWAYLWTYNSIDPGSVSGNQVVCNGLPTVLASTNSASPHTLYQWQYYDNTWIDIAGASSPTYLPPANPSNTRSYRRKASCSISANSCYGQSISAANLIAYSNIVTVSVGIPQPNDYCGNATIIQINNGANIVSPISYNTCAATPDGPLTTCSNNGSNIINNNIWYKFTIPSSGSVSFSLINTSYDARLTVYTGTSCSNLIERDCQYKSNNIDPIITLSACSVTDYYISVGGVGSTTGTGILIISYGSIIPLLSASIVGDASICGINVDPLPLTTTNSDVGGFFPYNYQWQINPANLGFWVDIPAATNPTYDPGNTIVNTQFRRKVTDGCGTSVYSNVLNVNINPAPVLVLDNLTNPSCAGDNGGVQFHGINGTSPYQYELFNATNPPVNTNGIFQNLLAGQQYSYVVKDANLCASLPYTVQLNAPAPLVALCTEIQAIACSGQNYTIIANATGGTPPYQYQYADATGVTPFQSFPTFCTSFSGLLTIKDSKGCTIDATVTLQICQPDGNRMANPATISGNEENLLIDSEKIQVYPNPTQSELNIQIQNAKEGETAEIILYDMQGREVMRKTWVIASSEHELQTLDLSALSPQVYNLVLIESAKIHTFKVVKTE